LKLFNTLKVKNMRKKIFIALLFTFGNLMLNAQSNLWQQTSSPPGGSVWAITVIGNNIFAGATNGGVFFSSNNGVSWTQRNGSYTGMEVYSLVKDGNDLYAGTGGGFGAGIYKSSDLGLTWINITPSIIIQSTNVRSLVINGTDIFAGTDLANGIFKSQLNNISSSSWTNYNNGLTNQSVRSLAFIGSNILSGTYGNGVNISPTNSANWTTTSGITNGYIQALCVNGSTVFAGNISGSPVLYTSTNSGANWTVSSTTVFANSPVYALINNGNQIYAGTEGQGVFMSNNNGTTWLPYNLGFKDSIGNWFCNQINVRSFAILNGTLFAGTDCGIWKSNISGNTLTGLTQINNHDIKFNIFPNPAKEYFILECSDFATNNYQIKITNMLGQKILENDIDQQRLKIDVSIIGGKGIYFAQIINNSGKIIETKKIILN
jgi:hypothetical protein